MGINVKKALERAAAIREARDPVVFSNIDSLIDRVLAEINSGYSSGAIEWIKKNRPFTWRKLLALEQEISGASGRGDKETVVGALAKFKTLMLAAVEEFCQQDGR